MYATVCLTLRQTFTIIALFVPDLFDYVAPDDERRARLSMMKWIDIPPVWLAVFAVLAYWIGEGARAVLPRSLPLEHPVLDLLGGLLVGAGVLLMVLAVAEMRRARTTPIPHMQPSALVTGGIFGRSRNPIYLGDALVLAGLCLRWGWPALILVPLFAAVITDRFIRAEEARLHDAFGPEYDTWAARVRRWI